MSYEQFKAELTRDYELFAAALMGHYLAIVAATGAPAGAPYVDRFASLARYQVSEFIAGADNRIDHYATTVADGVDVDARIALLKQSLRVIVIKNARDLTTRLRGGNDGLKTLFNRPMGSVGLLLQQQLAKPTLKSADDAGRMWDSSKLVALIARDFAYQVLIDVQAATLTAMGETRARLVYPDTQHRNNGIMIDLADLPQLRHEIFHPNASAELTHV